MARGETRTITKVTELPMISTRSVWPSTTDRPRRTLERYCSPPTSRVCWTGWTTIFVAYTASDLRIFTFSSMPAFAFARMLPSIRRMANPISSAKPGQTNCCRVPLSHDLDNVSGDEVQFLHRIDTEPGYATTCIVVRRLFDCYLKKIRLCHRGPAVLPTPLVWRGDL